MIELIDQSRPASADPNALVACTYRCTDCGQTYQALTRARAVDLHKCGVAPSGEVDEVARMRQQVADLAALVAELRGAKPAPVATAENGAEPKPKRGRPRKAKAEEPTPA